jgi:hypothetical protein
MHIQLTQENIRFVSETMNEMQCTGSDFVNSLVAAVRESGYTREFTVTLTMKDNPEKKISKTVSMKRRMRRQGYKPREF